jgi:hypothetical protein
MKSKPAPQSTLPASLMEYKIEVPYSSHFYSSAAKTFLWREYGLSCVYYGGIPLATFALCLTSSDIAASRAGNIFTGFMLGIAATVGFLFLYQFLSIQRATSEAAKKWVGVQITYQFNEDGIVAESEPGSGRYTWKMVSKLRQYPNVWMIIFDEYDYLALPTELLNQDLQQFIQDKVTEIEGKSAS